MNMNHQCFSQDETKRIINDMVEKRNSIVPIIGDDMIVYKDNNSAIEIPFQEFIVQEFQKKYPKVYVSESDLISMKERGYYGLSLLSQYYNQHGHFLDDFVRLVGINSSRIRLKKEVHDFLVTFNFPIIITTLCFDIIENDLKDHVEGYKSVWYHPNTQNDTLQNRCVYHIFGQATINSEKWVSEEDELLTFLLSHNNKETGAASLMDYLKRYEKKLFVLGCNLPNWLFRFLWQPIQVGKTTSKKTTQGYWINKEKPEDSFENFLNKINFSADEQIKEILVDSTKLLKEEVKKGEEERRLQIDAEEYFGVFISYASEDWRIANGIYEVLRNMGINAWFAARGEGEITPGDPYWEKIKKGIKHSAHFMPIITGNWMRKLTSTSSLKDETYLVRDWLAECKKTDASVQLKANYSIPVIVKDSFYNGVAITEGYIEQVAGLGVLPDTLFNGIDMISFDEKNISVFEKIEW